MRIKAFTVFHFYKVLLNLLHFQKVVRPVAGMEKEPDLLYKVVYPGFFRRAPDVDHPLVGGGITVLTMAGGYVPDKREVPFFLWWLFYLTAKKA